MLDKFYLSLYREWQKESKNESWEERKPRYSAILFALFSLSFLFFVYSYLMLLKGNEEMGNHLISLAISTAFCISLAFIMTLTREKYVSDWTFNDYNSYLEYCIDLHDSKFRKHITKSDVYEKLLLKVKETRIEAENKIRRPNKIANAVSGIAAVVMLVSSVPNFMNFLFGEDFTPEKILAIYIPTFTFVMFFTISWILTWLYSVSENIHLKIYRDFERDLETIIDLCNDSFVGYENRISFIRHEPEIETKTDTFSQRKEQYLKF